MAAFFSCSETAGVLSILSQFCQVFINDETLLFFEELSFLVSVLDGIFASSG